MKTTEPRVFWLSYRVSYGETDKMGIVYYAQYLHFFERARTEYLRNILGVSYLQLEQEGFFLPVCHAECSYKRSISYDEHIFIKTWISLWKHVSLTFSYEIYNEHKTILYAEGKTRLACVNNTSSPQKLPSYLHTAYISQEYSI